MDSSVKTNLKKITFTEKTFFTDMKESNIPAINLTLRYQQKLTEEVLYRENDYTFAITTLLCRHKNNLAIIGKSGVGKTAFIHYLARYIDKILPEYSLTEVNIPALLSGCAYRGEFEKKLIKVIESAISYKTIVYFDEAHALAMTGGSNTGGIDAMNILKPYLTHDLRCIISTTTDESILLRNDIAFSRRFRYLELKSLTDEMKNNILIAKFGNNEVVKNYIKNFSCDSKPLYEMIDDIDFIFSQNKLMEFNDEIYTK